MSKSHIFKDFLPSDITTEDRITFTQKWIEQIVIDMNLCPWAHRVYAENKVLYLTSELRDFMSGLSFIQNCCNELSDSYDTALIIYDEIVFDKFIDFVEIIMEFFQSSGLSGTFQIAHFHPQYQFANTDKEQNSNYTNRSPFPIIQILRVEQVALAIENYPDVDMIPEKNIRKLESMSRIELREIYQSILKRQ